MPPMRVVRYPAVHRLTKNFLDQQLPAQGIVQPVGTKNPRTLPPQWIRLRSQGGPKSLWEWRCMMDVFVYANDETVAEDNANLVHSLMLDAAGVAIQAPEFPQPFTWVRLTRHISGPTPVEDEELPDLECYRFVVVWHILPIP